MTLPLLCQTSLGSWVFHILGGALVETGAQLAVVAVPVAVVTLLLHWLERMVQRPLAARFGWRSLLWTGWLGTPVHELSHAAVCLLFGHRIDRLSLFGPDPEAGRMGYVQHSYNRRNAYQVVGNFFIGLAPLVGGTLMLYGLLWLFYPEAAGQAFAGESFRRAAAGSPWPEAVAAFAETAAGVLRHLLQPGGLVTARFWIFLYLVLCVGSHMAPSGSDYRGGLWGGMLLLGLLLIANVVLLAVGVSPEKTARAVATVMGPALALFALCALLCSIASGAVIAIHWSLGTARGRRRRDS